MPDSHSDNMDAYQPNFSQGGGSEPTRDELEQRIQNLESRLQRVEQQLEKYSADEGSTSEEQNRKRSRYAREMQSIKGEASESDRSVERSGYNFLWSSDFWINKVGIALLVVGVGYLFKYAIDQNWMGAMAQFATGGAGAALLIWWGVRTPEDSYGLRSVLIGGGFAVGYLTIFAASLLYGMLPVTIAFILALLITIAGWIVSWFEDNPWVGEVAVLGGYSALFLNLDATGLIWGTLYALVIGVGGIVLYYLRGWRRSQDVTLATWLTALLVFTVNSSPILEEAWTVAQLISGVLILSTVLIAGVMGTWLSDKVRSTQGSNEFPLSWSMTHVFVPLLAAVISSLVWDLGQEGFGMIMLGLTALYIGWAINAESMGYSSFKQRTFWRICVIIGAAGLLSLLEGPMVWIATAGFGTLWLVSFDRQTTLMALPGHILMAVSLRYVAEWFIIVFTSSLPPEGMMIDALTSLTIIIFYLIIVIRRIDLYKLYAVVTHLLILGWLYTVMVDLVFGAILTTLCWFIYSVGLFLLGYFRSVKELRTLAFITLLLTIGKLTLLDLSEIEAIWRVIVFISLGGTLLGLSYYLTRRESK